VIVCHCNCIDHTSIEDATSRLLAEDPWRLVTPGSVYRALGKRPRCGGCLPLATTLIYAHIQCRAATGTTCPLAALAAQVANGEAVADTSAAAGRPEPRIAPPTLEAPVLLEAAE
jgi:bacterioferritin-associated ferredoxin